MAPITNHMIIRTYGSEHYSSTLNLNLFYPGQRLFSLFFADKVSQQMIYIKYLS